MTLTGALIVIPGVCYALASLIYAYQQQWPMSVVYAGYSFSNYGLFLIDKALSGKI